MGHGSSRVLLRGKISAAAGLEGDRVAQEWAKAFYRSKRWLKCRNAYIKARILADGGLCEECHDKPGYLVHHRKPIGGGSSLTCSFEEDGQPISMREVDRR